jgi:hypothetical protein
MLGIWINEKVTEQNPEWDPIYVKMWTYFFFFLKEKELFTKLTGIISEM